MKKRIALLFATLLLTASAALAAPQLTNVFADDVSLVSGQEGWFIEFVASEGGTMAMELLSGETGEKLYDLGAVQVEAGHGQITWDGLLPDGSAVAPGSYMVAIQMKNFWNEESSRNMFSLDIYGSEEEVVSGMLDLSALEAAEAIAWEEPAQEEASNQEEAPAEGLDENGVPVASSFWDMNPDLYDLDNPAHQQAIWEIMMQPLTVIDGDQTENIYITNKPGVSARPYKDNCAGELHGQSQGVNILEDDADGDGYVLIEAFSNDGTKSESTYVESLAADRVQGYIKKSRLYTDEPSRKYGILVDKLRQTLYLFEDGKIISSLLVSTGLNNKNQPYNETPAGEFLTVSRVGDFKAGSRTIGRFAIRFNGGTLLHEVLHDVNADGSRNYSNYEPDLGQKASHGCVRIPRRANEEGINMQWLWSNLENKTKVIIWDDKGRKMYAPELPDDDLQLYRNPDGGSNYHLDQNCSGVRAKFLPLTGDFTYGDLTLDAFKKLTPCVYCDAPKTKKELKELYLLAAEQIGAEVSEEYLSMFE